ncbi:hypothetical protein IEO21_08778 [Rhodonia placenta]|uniref:Homeobox domain-containing protein n=1 Tax=Rhodonia placenta TaxID=104341 RepID=A0A8H7TYH8_9APHY|nr:hypothetical protein IEO21_08778 [Postia placenta]
MASLAYPQRHHLAPGIPKHIHVARYAPSHDLVTVLLTLIFPIAFIHIVLHNLRRPLSIIIPPTTPVLTSPSSAQAVEGIDSRHDELLQRKERTLQRRRLGRRIVWDIGVWVLLVPVGGAHAGWAGAVRAMYVENVPLDASQPATLKNANMNTKISGTCGTSQAPTCTKKPPPNRVIADDRQLVILKSLWQCGPNPTKEHVLRAVRDTGLKEKWIRDWMQRQRRKKRSLAAGSAYGNSSSTRASSSSGSVSGTGSAISASLRIKQYEDLGNGIAHKIKSLEASGGREEHTSLEARVSSTLKSEAANDPEASHYTLPDGFLGMRSLSQSPSLGYIPLAFPMMIPGAFEHGLGSGSGSYVYGGTQHSNMYSQPAVPSAPVLPPVPSQITQAQTQDGGSNMFYLAQLLLDATDALPHDALLDPEPSSYLSALSQSPTGVLSFAPSLQSHSTSVLGHVTTGSDAYSRFPPAPVAYTAPYSDVAALTKRIRVTLEDNAKRVSDAESPAGMDTPEQSSLTRETDAPFEARLARDAIMQREESTKKDSGGPPRVAVSPAAEEEEEADEEVEALTPTDEIPAFIHHPLLYPAQDKGKGVGRKLDFNTIRGNDPAIASETEEEV